MLPLFVCIRFQVLFHSPPGVLFAFPSRYWFTIGRLRVFSLGGWSPHLQTGLHVSRPTCRTLSTTDSLSCKGLSPSMASISRDFHYPIDYHIQAHPISLATTLGISVDFFSSGYLDVSVHRVPFHTLWIGVWMTEVFSAGFPHSDISGSMDICSSPKLFAAYHVLHRLLVPRHPPCALIA